MYRYCIEPCPTVDMDDLKEDEFFILCIERDEHKTAYIWKGMEFPIDEV
jgi:hypothetical protein